MAQQLTPAERQRIIEAIKAGQPRNEIARETGRAPATVTLIAQEEGLSFDRADTKAATEARVTDIRARLAALADGLVADAERLRGQLFAPHVAFAFGGKDNEYNEHEIPEPTARDKQAIMTSIGIAVDKARQITAAEAPGGEEARSLVRDLLDGISEWAADA
jgi:transposase-like protein